MSIEHSKILDPKYGKFGLFSVTGTGKELSTLTLLVTAHKLLLSNGALKDFHIHTILGTIPKVLQELIIELATNKAMLVNNDDIHAVEFKQIKAYVTNTWRNAHFRGLPEGVKAWVEKNVTTVADVKDIPTHDMNHEIPILLAGAQDVGVKRKDKYLDLEKRLGILAVSEGHKIFPNDRSKIFKNLSRLLPLFFILVTATPYEMIFNDGKALYFNADECTLFTQVDQMEDRRTNPNSPYKNFPEPRYFELNGLEQIKTQLLRDGTIELDEEGFNWKKFFYSQTPDGEIKYEKEIQDYVKRVYVDTNDRLNIDNVALCDVAKDHGVIAIPPGTKDLPVAKLLPKLAEIIQKVVPHKVLNSVDHNNNDVNQCMENGTPSLYITCNKDLTGTNIPAWGHLQWWRELTNSIVFWIQAIGRPGREFANKENFGIFIASMDGQIEHTVTAEFKIQSLRKQPKSIEQVIKSVYNCGQYFVLGQTGFTRVTPDSFEKKAFDLQLKGNSNLTSALGESNEVPPEFDIEIKPMHKSKKVKVQITNNKKAGGKNTKTEVISEQLEMDLIFDNKEEFWKEFKKRSIAKLKVVAFVEGIQDLKALRKFLSEMAGGKHKQYRSFLPAYKLVAHFINSQDQIDEIVVSAIIEMAVVKSNRTDIEGVLAMFDLPELQETNFIRTPIDQVDSQLQRHIVKGKETEIGDPCAGTGIYLIRAIKKYGVDPSRCYYNDINPVWYNFFKKINKTFSLGVPEQNIHNQDIRSILYDKQIQR